MAALAVCGLLGTASAQTAEQYSFTTSTGSSLEDMTGADFFWGPGGGADYASKTAQSMGFTFTYEDVPYTQYGVNTYGVAVLGGGSLSGGLPGSLTQGSGSFPRLFPFGIEAGTVGDGWVKTNLIGTPGNYIRVIEWFTGLPGYDTGVNADITYQLLFHEATNEIEFRYGAGHGDTQWNNNAMVGMTGASSAHYQNVKPDNTVITNTPSGQWTSADWPGNGRSFLFSPPQACNAAPNPGDTEASAASICSGMTVSLNVENDESGPGILFQWESSTDGGTTWDPISGANGPTHNSGPLSQETMFHCAVTCSGTSQTTESTPITIEIDNPTPDYYPWDGTSTYTQNFSSWMNLCSVTDVPSEAPLTGNYWITTPAYGSNTWRANTMHASGGMSGVGSIAWNNGAVSPAASFYARQNTNTGIMDFHVDMSNGTAGAMLRFEYYHPNSSGNLQVLVSTDGGTSFTQVGSTLMNTPINTWVTQEFTIGSASATTVIRLKATGSMSNNNPLLVDNFRIIPEPTCKKVTGVSASVTGAGEATVSFTCTTCGGNYIIEYGPTNFTPGTAGTAGTNGTIVNSTGSPEIISGIAAGNYDVYVREDCGGGDYSENSTKATFIIIAGDYCENAIDIAALSSLDWDIIATTVGAGNQYATSACGAMPNNDVILYHDVEPGATLQLGLWANANKLAVAYGGSCPGTTSLACTNGGYFTLGGNIIEIDDYPTLVWTNNGCNTERIYVMADGTNATGGPLYAFNYVYTAPTGPVCAAVTGVTVSTVNTGTGANVSWDASCSGDVVVEYGLSGFTPGTGTSVAVSGTSTGLSGLTMDVAYDVYVRQDCGGGVYSNYGSATTFTVFNGDDCSRIINMAGTSGSITVNTTGTNNDWAFCDGGDTGGDLVFFTAIADGDGIYIETAPVAPYTGRVVFGAGMTCPGQVLLDCQSGAADFYWQNTTGSTVNLYMMQDGADEGETVISWEKYIFEKVVLSITTDNNPGDLAWEIVDDANQVVASGAPVTANATETTTVALPSVVGDPAWYGLRLTDSNGDGITGGGWELRSTDGKLIMRDAFDLAASSSPMVPGHTASYGAYHTFALPIGAVDIHPDECGIMDNQPDNKVYAVKQAGKNYQGATLNYQFEFLNPDSGRVRRTKKNRNYVLWSELTNPDLVAGVTYYARVRTDKFGPITGERWGAGCEMAMDLPTACTGLIDESTNQYYSCNVERRFRPNSQIFAWPVYGATKYKFRVYNLGEGYDQEFISNNYKLELSWPVEVAPKLRNGYTYQVQVSALVNGVWTNYCAACPITINNNPSGHMVEVFGDATLWPNPARDGQVNLNIDGISSDVQHITVDVKDIYGQHVHGQAFENMGDRFNTVLDLPGDIATGIYLVNITVNGEVTTKRLSIVR